MPLHRISIIAVALLLAGCKLIDQTTFAPKAAEPSPTELAALPPVTGLPPLLTIRYGTPNPSYQEQLRIAVSAAEQRRPGALYDVVAAVPAAPDPALRRRELDQTRPNAVAVMRSMIQLGVPDTRIGLGARTDPAATVREVRVYVR